MNLSEKYDLITTSGKYIGVRSYYNYFINLYLLDDEFYELWYFRDDNKIEKIEKLTDKKKLDLYIGHMNKLDNSDKTRLNMPAPKNIDECIEQLVIMIGDDEKDKIHQMDEDDFLIQSHFGLGMWIRNNWLYSDDSELTKYFNDKGIYHTDNMSEEILKVFYKSII